MPDIKKPVTQELAPADQTASVLADPFLKILSNPDKILTGKGAGNFDIYAEVLRDDQVKSTFQQRRLSVVAAPWEVEPGADDATSKAAAEALSENLKAINWDDITDKMLYSIFFGYGVGEILWTLKDNMIQIGGIKVRDRARFRFGTDAALYLQRPDYQFEPMPDRKFWVVSTGSDHSDNPYGVGLAHWLYWPTYFKRADIKFWLIFLEKFGMPTPMGKLPAGQAENKQTREKLLAALNAIATDRAVVIPDGAEVQLIEASRSGSGTYEELKASMDAAIAKIVLSQTMTTDNGSSRSQAEVHQGVADKVVKADADLICESFNRSVVQWWTEYNFPGAAPPRVWRRTEPDEDLSQTADTDKKIAELGFEPDEAYIKEKYGPHWKKKQAPEMIPGSAPAFGQPDPNAANFAESALLAALKAGHRSDQVAIVAAAERFASQYETVLGKRVQQLVEYADASGDYETFRKLLIEAFADQPAPEMANKIERGNLVSRLLGALRAQR